VHSLAKALAAAHADDRFAGSLKLEDLISQLKFMYRVNWRGEASQISLWVFDEHGVKRRARDVYMDCNLPSSASSLLRDRRRFNFLHTDIANALQNVDQWQHWLTSSAQIAVHPRLKHDISPGTSDQFVMHRDFQHLLTAISSKELLQLLKDNNYNYSWSLRPDERKSKNSEPNLSRINLAQQLASLPVLCLDGNHYQLSQTFLFLRELREVAPDGCFPFVDVEDPDHDLWRYVLAPFGVGQTDNFAFYIACMRGWKAKADPPIATIFRLLEYIQARSGEVKAEVA
jgi:hypothetical protein